uniref:Mitochondrial outer membrane protein porin 2 n=1 Tax=Rhizophora mucronata TaxID=61149 RepID=A0A2P2K6G9_RHIMU
MSLKIANKTKVF